MGSWELAVTTDMAGRVCVVNLARGREGGLLVGPTTSSPALPPPVFRRDLQGMAGGGERGQQESSLEHFSSSTFTHLSACFDQSINFNVSRGNFALLQ